MAALDDDMDEIPLSLRMEERRPDFDLSDVMNGFPIHEMAKHLEMASKRCDASGLIGTGSVAESVKNVLRRQLITLGESKESKERDELRSQFTGLLGKLASMEARCMTEIDAWRSLAETVSVRNGLPWQCSVDLPGTSKLPEGQQMNQISVVDYELAVENTITTRLPQYTERTQRFLKELLSECDMNVEAPMGEEEAGDGLTMVTDWSSVREIDPLTKEPWDDPYRTRCGHSFSRDALFDYIRRQARIPRRGRRNNSASTLDNVSVRCPSTLCRCSIKWKDCVPDSELVRLVRKKKRLRERGQLPVGRSEAPRVDLTQAAPASTQSQSTLSGHKRPSNREEGSSSGEEEGGSQDRRKRRSLGQT